MASSSRGWVAASFDEFLPPVCGLCSSRYLIKQIWLLVLRYFKLIIWNIATQANSLTMSQWQGFATYPLFAYHIYCSFFVGFSCSWYWTQSDGSSPLPGHSVPSYHHRWRNPWANLHGGLHLRVELSSEYPVLCPLVIYSLSDLSASFTTYKCSARWEYWVQRLRELSVCV